VIFDFVNEINYSFVFLFFSTDFIEFLIAVSMTSTKDPIRKTELFFSMYDIDRNGLIDETEMRCVVEVSVRVHKYSKHYHVFLSPISYE